MHEGGWLECMTDGATDEAGTAIGLLEGVLSRATLNKIEGALAGRVGATGRGEGPTCHVVCNCLSTFVLQVVGVKPQYLQRIIVA